MLVFSDVTDGSYGDSLLTKVWDVLPELVLDLSPFLRQLVKRQYPANGGTEYGIVSTKVHA
jgi:hypothetical protein